MIKEFTPKPFSSLTIIFNIREYHKKVQVEYINTTKKLLLAIESLDTKDLSKEERVGINNEYKKYSGLLKQLEGL